MEQMRFKISKKNNKEHLINWYRPFYYDKSIKNPLTNHGIYYIHDETNIMKGYAMIIGPKKTIYQDGFFFFSFNSQTEISQKFVKFFENCHPK